MARIARISGILIAVASACSSGTLRAQASYTVLHSFGGPPADGESPSCALLQTSNGTFYGETSFGGTYDLGTVFTMDGSGSVLILHSFDGADGKTPIGGLTLATGDTYYGTTFFGGASNKGTVFKIDSSGALTSLHSFGAGEGTHPSSGLVHAFDGFFYGTTSHGGPANAGSIFRVDGGGTETDILETGILTTLHYFDLDNDGAFPEGRLIVGAYGYLYGTTYLGGVGYSGTVFRVDLSLDPSENLTVLHAFTGFGGGDDGGSPLGGVVWGSDGSYYGPTSGYQTAGNGTLFKIDNSGNLTTLHSFRGTDGGFPYDGLIQAADGAFYGTTRFGGAYNAGTVFRMDPSGDVTTLHSFNGDDGDDPGAGLVQGTDAAFYGTTGSGGSGGAGVIFRLDTSFMAASVASTSGPASGGTAVVVSGAGFDPASTVSIGGAAVEDVAIVSETEIDAVTPELSPGTLNDLTVTNPGNATATLPKAFLADFHDVSQGDIFHDYVETIFRHGITAGVGAGNYGRDNPVTREQMAVFLLKAKHGQFFVPPPCSGVFVDVQCPSLFADWIEELSTEEITGGCSLHNYCPESPVTRGQMAAFLLKTEHGPSYTPPACAGVFGDVACPSQFADWIERLYAEGVTGGCSASPLLYCPSNAVTRGQMAVFLTKAFGLL